MLEFSLKRFYSDSESTRGIYLDDSGVLAVTLERPWLNNKQQVSCIPCGVYICKRVKSPKFGITFEVTNVPNRSHILHHSGNFVKDTLGCVILGVRFGKINNTIAVLDSKKAFNKFMDKLTNVNEFKLNVVGTEAIEHPIQQNYVK